MSEAASNIKELLQPLNPDSITDYDELRCKKGANDTFSISLLISKEKKFLNFTELVGSFKNASSFYSNVESFIMNGFNREGDKFKAVSVVVNDETYNNKLVYTITSTFEKEAEDGLIILLLKIFTHETNDSVFVNFYDLDKSIQSKN